MRVVVKVALQDPLDSRFLPKIHQLHTMSAEPGSLGEVPPPPVWPRLPTQQCRPRPRRYDGNNLSERERERDASSELLSPDLISVPAIPGNFAGHEVGDTSNLLVLGAPDAPIVQISCVTVWQFRQNDPSQLTTDHHNVSTCAGGRVSPAAEARVSSNVGILTPGDL